MHATLNLIDHLLARGQRFQEMGRHRDALALFTKLSVFRELPPEAAAETQVRLGELHLRRRRYRLARRHLTAALRHHPDSARYHFLMATAVRAGDLGNLERAADHYRCSLELNPDQPRCLGDYGLLAVRLGRVDEGIGHLQRAAELAPDRPEVLGKLVQGLRMAGRADEARAALQAALFRNPRCPRVRRLWADCQFQELRRRRAAEQMGHDQDDEGPVLLPFVRLVREAPAPESVSSAVRRDEPAALPAPHHTRLRRRADQRHVQ